MSRLMPAADTETFRVTITATYALGSQCRQTYGPFATLSTAKSTVTRETKNHRITRADPIVTALIERAELNWKTV